jgi:hypothetical protein
MSSKTQKLLPAACCLVVSSIIEAKGGGWQQLIEIEIDRRASIN